MPDWPGWDSLSAVSRIHSWGEITGIAFLALLVIAEAVTWTYGTRKDFLTEQQQTDERRRHDDEMTRVRRDTAQANERAAELAKETATLQWQLEQQRQKLAQRQLRPEQKSAMIAELRGKLSQILLVTQNDIETNAFSVQLMSVFSEAGVRMYAHEPPREVSGSD